MPRFAQPDITAVRHSDGRVLLSSRTPLPAPKRTVVAWLDEGAAAHPDRVFLTESDGRGDRRAITYGETAARARSLAASFVTLGASRAKPVMILSDNSIDHAIVALAAMIAGAPAAPISPAYSLQSRDHQKLREVTDVVDPAIVFAAAESPFADALDVVTARSGARAIVSQKSGASSRTTTIEELASSAPPNATLPSIAEADVAKILFTSGSTGAPKGVVNTHAMLTANQAQIAAVWPFLEDAPPVVVDWLPWSHTFGGNHNFHMVLAHGGTLHIDSGKPVPGKIEETVRLLSRVSPSLYFNVPRGFDALLPFLENDAALAKTFFAELDLIFYAAAALPQSTWARLERVASKSRTEPLTFTAAWGATETSPLVTSVHFDIDRAGIIGTPAPGCEIMLVPDQGKLEMRVRGPNVTPGHWKRGGEIAPLPRDEAGFYRTGDAGRLEDDADPNRGLVFDGRTAENFKLSSGTWVRVGELRVALVSALAPLVSDLVVCGHDRDAIAILIFPAPGVETENLHASLRTKLRAHNERAPGSSTRIARAIILDEAPSIDAGEITDKGYINQRAVIARRGSVVEALFAESPGAHVIAI